VVWNDPEKFIDLVEHLPMLTGDRHHAIKIGGLLKGRDDWSHFYGFRTSTENWHDAGHGFPRERQWLTSRCYRTVNRGD